MYEIQQEEFPRDFTLAWESAGMHIQQMGQEGIHWLHATLNTPVIEHLSFRLGNQLFFIYVDTDALPLNEARRKFFLDTCLEATATPCVLRMERNGASFSPARPGWGLVDAATGLPVNPTEMVSDELIEMSDWELHDFAIQVVRSYLEKESKEVFSAQSSLHVDPSIWFKDGGKPCWVVVRAGRYPAKNANRPTNLENIKESCAKMSHTGFFASVTVAAARDPSDSEDKEIRPLYRGHGMHVRFEGLESV